MRLVSAYLGMVIIWSTVPLTVKWSLDGASFIFVATTRVVIGALCILPLVALTRTRLPMERTALKAYGFSAINFLGMLGMYWGAQYIPSGWIGVTIATMPLTTATMAAIWLGERSLTPIKLAGLATGFAGVLLVFATAIDLRLPRPIGGYCRFCQRNGGGSGVNRRKAGRGQYLGHTNRRGRPTDFRPELPNHLGGL